MFKCDSVYDAGQEHKSVRYTIGHMDILLENEDTRETADLSFTWKDKRLDKGRKYGFYAVPYVNGEYMPIGLSHAR